MFSIGWLTVVACQALLATFLARRLGLALGITAHVFVLTLSAAGGWYLLTQLTTDQITWRNRLISVLMPWPAVVGGGSIAVFVIKNFFASIVFALTVVAADRFHWFSIHNPTPDVSEGGLGPRLVTWSTILCWIVLAVAWLYLIRATLTNRPDILSTLTSVPGTALPLLLPPIMVTASLVLRYKGQTIASLLAVAIPLLLILMPVLLMALVILFHYVTGKPIRWN